MGSSTRSRRTSRTSDDKRVREERAPPIELASRVRETFRDGYRVIVDDRTSRRMADIRQHGTKPELIVRSIVTALGQRYRVSNRDLPGAPDLANRRRRWAIFVHGCYWHRHSGCRLATTPTRNREFWVAKFDRNVARDAKAVAELRALGFRVAIAWECETRDPADLTRRLASWLAAT
jgi:DNA mismatch endonuclease, patch repair protein